MHTKLPEVRELARRAFPAYTGQRFSVEPFTQPLTTTSDWDGGGRDYWCLVNLATNKTWLVPENGPPFVNGGKKFKIGRLPANVALVRHYHGRFESITIYLHPANLRADLLPQKPSLAWPDLGDARLVATTSQPYWRCPAPDFWMRDQATTAGF
jgi:hypothetical protein